mmetsp:Transcript_129580/g.415462  ORF Transcript_129580/g.415462 Transcript_129580/m.415462 type:complete len:170 (-) Transcript_129580:162-671(-)
MFVWTSGKFDKNMFLSNLFFPFSRFLRLLEPYDLAGGTLREDAASWCAVHAFNTLSSTTSIVILRSVASDGVPPSPSRAPRSHERPRTRDPPDEDEDAEDARSPFLPEAPRTRDPPDEDEDAEDARSPFLPEAPGTGEHSFASSRVSIGARTSRLDTIGHATEAKAEHR